MRGPGAWDRRMSWVLRLKDARLVRCLALIGITLLAGVSDTWAANPTNLGGTLTGVTMVLNGLTLSNISCSSTTITCANLELLGVSSGRGTVTVEIVDKTNGTPIVSLSSGSATDTLNVGYTATTNTPATAKITSATLTLNASDTNTWDTNDHANWGQTDTPGPNPAAIALTSGTATSASATYTPGTPGTSDTIVNTIALTRTSGSGDTLTLTSAIEKFVTTPEPASIGVLLLGLGGLAAARRRRASQD
jgi:hypothetical protein